MSPQQPRRRRAYVPRLPALIPEIDSVILSALPKEGSKLGVKPNGRQVKALAVELAEQQLSSAEISARIRSLSHEAYGYVVQVTVLPVSQGPGYQITKAGEKYLASTATEE